MYLQFLTLMLCFFTLPSWVLVYIFLILIYETLEITNTLWSPCFIRTIYTAIKWRVSWLKIWLNSVKTIKFEIQWKKYYWLHIRKTQQDTTYQNKQVGEFINKPVLYSAMLRFVPRHGHSHQSATCRFRQVFFLATTVTTSTHSMTNTLCNWYSNIK